MHYNKVKFGLRLMNAKLNRNQLAPIYLRMRLNKKEKNLSTGIWIYPGHWQAEKSRVKATSDNNIRINKELSELESNLYRIIDELKFSNQAITLDAIELRLRGKNSIPTLMEAFEQKVLEMSNILNKGFSKGRIKHYKTVKNKVLNFLKNEYKNSDIHLTDLNFSFIQRFESFLCTQYGNGLNTIRSNIKILKAVVNNSIRSGWLKEDPFNNYKCKEITVVKPHLTQLEIEKLEKLDFAENKSLECARDLFLFMCYTGLSYSDMRDLNAENIVLSIRSFKHIIINRNKTKVTCDIPLLPKAERILEKYSANQVSQYEGKLLPVFTNEYLNKLLKQLSQAAGITKKLSCHVGRHTFATLALENNIPIETIQRNLGHNSIKTTQMYSKVTSTKIENDYFKMFGEPGKNKAA